MNYSFGVGFRAWSRVVGGRCSGCWVLTLLVFRGLACYIDGVPGMSNIASVSACKDHEFICKV